ncbi:MAG: hypothetical protein BGO49_30790 [Planctomycetales bacterium 71-10]|nr:MAG: hypothetical protein BGO49_30790 [Planctomycetales bacterium 71-10]
MPIEIEECDLWWFRELTSVLGAFADDPEHTISRVGGGGEIAIGEDLAEDLHHYLVDCILAKYPEAAGLAIVQAAREIESALARKSFGGEAFEEDFWSNASFRDHPEWEAIRDRARAFLMR